MENNKLTMSIRLQDDDTQVTGSVINLQSSAKLVIVQEDSMKQRLEGIKLLVRNKTNVDLLAILRAPQVKKETIFFKTNQATQKFATQINEAIQINQGIKRTNSFVIRQGQKFQQYINTNLIEVLRQKDADMKCNVLQIETKHSIYDSFLTQRKSVHSINPQEQDSQQNSSNQDDDKDQQFQKSPDIDDSNDLLRKSPFAQYGSDNKSQISNMSECVKKKSFKIRQVNQSLMVNQSQQVGRITHSNLVSPRQSVQINVVTTSKLEKSINLEGNSKLNDYTINGYLGQGAFGKVKLAQNSKGEQFAIKIANKSKLKRKMFSMKSSAYTLLDREIAIMKKIHHPHVVQLNEVIDDPAQDKLYLVMEYMAKGSILSKTFFKNSECSEKMILEELKDQDKTPKFLTPEDSIYFFRQFILGLDYLHNYVGVIHRDIKPENLLVSMDKVLKIADFGVSHIMENEDPTISSQQGTQAFLAPEAWCGKQFDGMAVDIWAGGVTLYQFIYNRLPFASNQSIQLKQQILNQIPDFPDQQGYPIQALQLVKTLLEKDPDKRAKMDQIMVCTISHKTKVDPWLTDHGNFPLVQIPQIFEDITDVEIKSAITKLNMKMALITATRMLSKVRKSRMSLSNRAAALLQ